MIKLLPQQIARLVSQATFILFIAMLVNGCTPTVNVVTKPAAIANITITATAGVNPDSTGRSSPLSIRIYELGAAGAFKSAEFFPLFDSDTETLGRDLLNKESLLVQPLTSHSLSIALNQDTKFIGVMAGFSNIDQAQWRAVVPIESDGTVDLKVIADKQSISVTAK